MRKLQLNNK